MSNVDRKLQYKYPPAMRTVHWMRALVVIVALTIGLIMVNLPEESIFQFDYLYPTHKQLGIVAFILATVQLMLHRMNVTPSLPQGLPRWERVLSKAVHRLLYALLILVPVMGYCMSSSFTQSDGVPFLFFHVPELLPKNDDLFRVFQAAHRYLSYAFAAAIGLHVLGTLKHRYLDADKANDVLPRML